MQKWEYCAVEPNHLVYFTSKGDQRQEFGKNMRMWEPTRAKVIAQLGEQGWEMVGADIRGVYFKRPKP
jgi:hypothetical protein